MKQSHSTYSHATAKAGHVAVEGYYTIVEGVDSIAECYYLIVDGGHVPPQCPVSG